MITSSSSALTSSRVVGLHDSQAPAGDFVADMSAAGIRSIKPILLSGPHVDTLPWRGTELLAEASACKPAWKPFKTLVNATAVPLGTTQSMKDTAGLIWSRSTLLGSQIGFDKRPRRAQQHQKAGRFLYCGETGLAPGKSGTLLVVSARLRQAPEQCWRADLFLQGRHLAHTACWAFPIGWRI